MIFALDNDQYNEAYELIQELYEAKLLMLSEKASLKELFELLLYGDMNVANKLYAECDDYIKHQAEKILKQVK